MASRILNRRELREQNDHAEQQEQSGAVVAEVPEGEKPVKKRKPKAPGAPRVRKPRAKKVPPRFCARWGIFDNSMKQVAIFNYNERPQADEKLADLLTKKPGYSMQVVKEAMPEPVVVEPAPAQ